MPIPVDAIRNQLELISRYEIECVIIGGVAAIYHGSSDVTHDLDICYARDKNNLDRIVAALKSVDAFLRGALRGAPRDIPFILDAETLKRLNFTFETSIGSLDLLGEVRGVGTFAEVARDADAAEIFGHEFQVVSLEKLIKAKRTAGRVVP